ncbi:winged helix-turn-helix domain-containing protein [Candidatus Pelagibacter sp.]|nr:winged helix-turn-helix domain-containing protein [Candidatus Pelagibacter sp.]
MHKQILIIFKFKSLFKIINELENELNFNVIEVSEEIDLMNKLLKFNNSLIVTQKKEINKGNQLILNQLPIKISKLLEKINIEFLKLQFNEKSKIDIGKYKIDLNSRYLISNDQKLKLTEKEADIIIYLYKSNSPVKINQLQKEVWGFKSKLETHTVETHIYRLRKKILEIFKDNDFIISKKNGYKIN